MADGKKAFGVRLRALRKARGLTQQKLADNVDRSVEAIGQFERGLSYPAYETLDAFTQVLETPASALFGEKTSEHRIELEARIAAAMARLDDDTLEIAAAQIEALAATVRKRPKRK
jgi:transcriptional regulator with XRE-family HTH domain